MRLIKDNLFLVLIIFFAATLRLVNLSSIPAGFNDDEVAFGYNAYSILKTGRDEWSRFLPFPVFESFGDWKLVGYLYLTVISQFLFGVNEFATRLPSALFGILSVFATYLLAQKLFDNQAANIKKSIALVSAFFLAISPWHIVASRNAFESDVLIFFITICVYCFLKGLTDRKFLTLSFVGFAISFYIYRSSWLFVPLFVLSLLVLHRNQLNKIKKDLIKNVAIALIILLPLIPTVLTFKGQARFFQESFLAGVGKSGIIDDVNQRRGVCSTSWPKIFCVAVYNKYLFFFSTYLNNYSANLSPETYYINGNSGGYQSFSIRGLFYTFELPLLVLGLIVLTVQKHSAARILLPWVLLVPLGASITGVGNPGRLNILMPTTQIIASFGLITLYNFISSPKFKKLLIYSAALVITVALIRLVADMFLFYPIVSARYQRYGYKQLFDYLESQKPNYNLIAVSRKNDDAKQYIHYLFFEKYDPNSYLNSQNVVKYRGEDKWQVVEQIDKIKFYPVTPNLRDLPQQSLLAVGEKEVSFNLQPVFFINDLKGDRLFEVYDVDLVKKRLKELDKLE